MYISNPWLRVEGFYSSYIFGLLLPVVRLSGKATTSWIVRYVVCIA
jgi:hypothetical protein